MNIKQLIYSNEENKISRNLSVLLSIHALFMIATGMSNIFLNIFIWKVSKDIGLVIEYNMLLVTFLPIAYMFGGWISKRKGLRINLILGMSLYTIFYVIVFLFRNNISEHIFLIGMLRGISAGFYFIAFNVLGYDFSTDKNRDYFFGLLGLINSTSSMLSPFISGFIISRFNGNYGYELVFIASFVMFFIGSVISFAIPNNFVKSKFHLLSVIALPFKNKNWSKIMLSETARGTRDMVMSFLINIIIFTIVASESTIGYFSFWTFLIATITCYAAGILINQKTRVKYLLVGSLFTAIFSSVFIYKLDMSTLWIFGIGTAIFMNLVLIPHNTISFAVISSIPKSRARRIEAIIVKEIFLNIGRFSSLAVFALLTNIYKPMPDKITGIYIFVLGILQLSMWALLTTIDTKKVKRHIGSPNIEHEHKILGLSSCFHCTTNVHGTH